MTTNTETTTARPTIAYLPKYARPLASGSVAIVNYDNKVGEIYTAEAWDELTAYGDPFEDATACHDCDGHGHGYMIGWELDEAGETVRPVYSGPCIAYEDRGWLD